MDREISDPPIGYTLWGDPVYRMGNARGRPPFEWTQENSHKISMLLAMGWTNERIAGVILDPRTGKPISTPTLKRHFRSELAVRDQARDQLFAKQLMVALNGAFDGNVGAQKFLQALIEKNDMALLESRRRAAPSKPKEVEPPAIGKKAQKVADAQKVPDDYGDIFARRERMI